MPSATTSDYLHDTVMNRLLLGSPWTPPSSLWVALFTTVPALDGTGGTEVSTTGTGYGRQELVAATPDWGATGGSSREYSNLYNIDFNAPSADWGTITGAGLYDAETGNSGAVHLYYVANLTTYKTVNNGDGAPKILSGQLRISRSVCP